MSHFTFAMMISVGTLNTQGRFLKRPRGVHGWPRRDDPRSPLRVAARGRRQDVSA